MKHDYKKLHIWNKARELNLKVYSITQAFPELEKFNLIIQMRKASVSISSNISEGSSFESEIMFIRYLNIALGSLCELESQIYLSSDLGYITQKDLVMRTNETEYLKRMILSFKKCLINERSLD